MQYFYKKDVSLSTISKWHICPKRCFLFFMCACEILHNSADTPTSSHWIRMHAFFVILLHSTSMRPMRTETRWFLVKGRMVWCMQEGIWATKYESPSRRFLRRTARTRNKSFFPSFSGISTGDYKAALFLICSIHSTLNGKRFGRIQSLAFLDPLDDRLDSLVCSLLLWTQQAL